MNHGPTFAFSTITLAVTAAGFLNGAFLGVLFRRKWWWLWALFGAALFYGAQEMYWWYGRGYVDAGRLVSALAYGSCALVTAGFAGVLPLGAAALASLSRRTRRPARWLGGVCAVVLLGGGLLGVTRGNAVEEIHEISVVVPGLPASFEGYRIAQLSDTHIGPYYRCDDLDAALGAAGVKGADLAVITGDLIDDTRQMGDAARIMKSRKRDFADGILFIWGNHEYYRGREALRPGFAGAGVPVLENAHTTVYRGGDALYIAGADYPWARGLAHEEEMHAMADAAFAGIPEGAPVIFLAHHSDLINEGFARGAALTLTGHTHGMQFGIGGRPVFTPFKYTRGFYSDGVHSAYVSCGDGGWFPFRLGCRRELVIFTLHGQ